jgi:hypothetical protein
MSKEVIAALDRVIGYFEDEQEDYELSDPARRQKHIWTAVQVLIRHRDDLALDDD